MTFGEQIAAKTDLALLEQRLMTRLAQIELRLTIAMGTIVAAGIGILRHGSIMTLAEPRR